MNQESTQSDGWHALEEAATLWAAGVEDRDDLVRAAADAVGLGLGDVALACLAGEATGGVMQWDFPEIVQDAMEEVDIRLPAQESELARMAELRLLRRQVLELVARHARWAAWAHSAIGHEGPAAAAPMVELDDMFGLAGTVYDDGTMQVKAVSAARAVLRADDPTRR